MAASGILNAFARNWWVLLVRGVIAVLFGLMAFAWPRLTLLTLVLLFGVYALADGLTALWVRAGSRAWSLVLLGILGIVVGIYTFISPGITALALLYLIAAWAIVRGVFEVIGAMQLRREVRGEWALILSGIISIILGVVLFANPAAGALAMVWVIGAFALVFGVTMIILAFRLRGLLGRLEKPAGGA